MEIDVARCLRVCLCFSPVPIIARSIDTQTQSQHMDGLCKMWMLANSVTHNKTNVEYSSLFAIRLFGKPQTRHWPVLHVRICSSTTLSVINMIIESAPDHDDVYR